MNELRKDDSGGSRIELFARKHLDKVNLLVTEAKELAAKAEEELAELKSKAKPPAKKRGRKPTVKK